MLNYFFYLTNFTSLSLEDQMPIHKSLYYHIVPYFRKQQKKGLIAEQVGSANLFPFAIVRHSFQRLETLNVFVFSWVVIVFILFKG
jgi:hypothetical protein